MDTKYALHETLEVHEIAAFKTVCLTKSKTMQALVTDPDLQEILRHDVQVSTQQLQELSELLSKSQQGR
jgi:similar to spore coat protein